ncbi:hypothetical protein D3C84_142360 [compost metagenome]
MLPCTTTTPMQMAIMVAKPMVRPTEQVLLAEAGRGVSATALVVLLFIRVSRCG